MTELLSFDSTGYQFAWDSTSLGAFETCPRKYQYAHLDGWTDSIRSRHLVFGGHYARALEHYHKLVAAGKLHDDAVVTVVHEALLNTWDHEKGPNGQPIMDTGQAWDSMDSAKNRDNLIRTIVWYLEEFGQEDRMPTVILSDGRPAVEYSFSVELSDAHLYCGHIDRMVEYSGGKYVQDQKTTGNTVTQKFFADFDPDIQMSGYTFAGKIIFDLPVAGVVIDAAQIAVGFSRFSRGFVPKSLPILEEWRMNTIHTIESAKRAHDEQFYPMNRKSCSNYGGCEFRKVCSTPPSLRQNMLNGNYVKRERWDPLKKR